MPDTPDTPQRAPGGETALRRLFAERGPIARALKSYEERPQQVEMARAVYRAIRKKRPLVVQAPTGTGKTLAYVAAAVASGKRIAISTGTKALQDQLVTKDLPLLLRAWAKPVEIALLKGRRNYLCRLRFEQMLAKPTFRSPGDLDHWSRIIEWAEQTESGDRAEIEGLPDHFPTWAELSVGAEGCLGPKCPKAADCHVLEARKRAAKARVVVVNHHLFFAALSNRAAERADALPELDAIIFDEAHHIEQIAGEYFGTKIASSTLAELWADVGRILADSSGAERPLERALDEAKQAGSALLGAVSTGLDSGRYAIASVMADPMRRGQVEQAERVFAVALGALERELRSWAIRTDDQAKLDERTARMKFDLARVLKAADERNAYLVEISGKSVSLHEAPIEVAALVRAHLIERHAALVFTSATLAAGSDFSFFRRRVGLRRGEGDELALGAVFDYAENALVYIPRRLPPPNAPRWAEGVAQIATYLIGLSQGRALLLFTSWANMRAVYEAVAPELPYTTLKQGDRSKRELLEAFRADESSVLFATRTFWEGIDVVGSALRLVLIDKLPFASPSDPLLRARLDAIEARGGNSFVEHSVPAAAIALQQGVGRLIRSTSDSGVVAILDSRIATKSYGRHFLKALPTPNVVWNARDVKAWWAKKYGAEA